jgi:hypothetical protein
VSEEEALAEISKWKSAHAAMVVCAEAAEKKIDELVVRAERAERERDLLRKELAARR